MRTKSLVSIMILSISLVATGCGKSTSTTNVDDNASTHSNAESNIDASSNINTTSTIADKKSEVTESTTIANTVAATVTPTDSVLDLPAFITGYSIRQINGVTYVNGILIANKTYDLPSTYSPGTLSNEVQRAFDAMQKAAAKEGLNIYISSGFRSYNSQSKIYNNYVNTSGKSEADRYSARAGFSEHQTGLAFDLNSIDDSFAATPEGIWVAAHAQEYGFIIRYPKGKEAITGYMYESWHLRYLGVETATAVYKSELCLEEYLGISSAYNN